jgi:uncharacterized protein YbjT (DUF2867 family)
MIHDIFVTGGTGYLGRPLIQSLLERGHRVRALTRAGSAARVPSGAIQIIGNALDASGWRDRVAPADTLVHLVGTPHPSPLKAAEFQSVDLTSIRAAVDAAKSSGIRHFVYVSVAHPAPVMRAFIEVRREGEALVRASGIPATVLRPWYILGPGHRWAYALVPIYALLRLLSSTRQSAERLALIPRDKMISALVRAVESPPDGFRIIEAPEILRAELASTLN